MSHARRRTQVERHIFKVDLFFDASILLEHERVVVVGHQQHIIDALTHQVLKRGVLEIKLTKERFVHNAYG